MQPPNRAAAIAPAIAPAIAHAPFRRHHATLRLGLAPSALADWPERPADLAARLALRRALLARHPERLAALPGAAAAIAAFAARIGTAPGLPAIATHIHEDVMLLAPEAGQHRLVAGILLFPSDWSLGEMLGKPVSAIHARVPGFAERLSPAVEHVLAQLSQPLTRSNWAITETPELPYSPAVPLPARFAHVTPANAGERLFLRVERQTLLPLPASHARAFTIAVHTAPLKDLPPALRAALVHALDTMPPAEAARRATHAFAPAIRGWAARLAPAPVPC